MVQLYFHGSQTGGLSVLEPRLLSGRRDQNEARLYASPELGIAAIFILDADDRIRKFGKRGSRPWIINVIDQAKFQDISGWIYTISNKDAILVQADLLEVYFKSPKKISHRLYVPSATDFIKSQMIKIVHNNPDSTENLYNS